jgi:putative tricarboxylic transport membrane protein
MRALAVSAPAGVDGIPSLKEQGVNVELGNWRGIFGAPGITPQQRDNLVRMVKAAVETPAWKEAAGRLGWATEFLGGDDYRKFLEEDTQRVSAILESLGLKK